MIQSLSALEMYVMTIKHLLNYYQECVCVYALGAKERKQKKE